MSISLRTEAERAAVLAKAMELNAALEKLSLSDTTSIDPNFGREEYIQDCVKRILDGKTARVTFSGGGMVPACDLPKKVQQKCGFNGPENSKDEIWFTGYDKAHEEVIKRVEAAGKKVMTTGFYTENSFFFDEPGHPTFDGYEISLLTTAKGDDEKADGKKSN